MTGMVSNRKILTMSKAQNEPTPEEVAAFTAVVEAIAKLTPEGRARVLKTVETFYGKPRPTRGTAPERQFQKCPRCKDPAHPGSCA